MLAGLVDHQGYQPEKGAGKALLHGGADRIHHSILICSPLGRGPVCPTFTSTTAYTRTEFTPEEATQAAEYYLAMANAYALESPRDKYGVTDFGGFSALEEAAGSGYDYLRENYGDRFDILPVCPKGLTFSRLMDLCGLTGIFTAYTGGNGHQCGHAGCIPALYHQHECAHRTTVTQEADANFVAFLACIHSWDPKYRYSGYYSAFIYCYNAIAKTDKETQAILWNGMNDQLRADVLSANATMPSLKSGSIINVGVR